MRGFHRLCATAVMSVARMLSVSRRISSALDNFNARVHQKPATVWKPTFISYARARLYRHTLIRTLNLLYMHRMARRNHIRTTNVDWNNRSCIKPRIQRMSDLRRSNIIHTIIKIMVLLDICELVVIAEPCRVNLAQPISCDLIYTSSISRGRSDVVC